MATKDRYITSNFTPSEPEEFKKWCKENKINIHPTEYGDNVYLTTSKSFFASDSKENPIVRFTKDENWIFRKIMIARIKYKGNYIMGCELYTVSDDGVKSCGELHYMHNTARFFNAILEEARR